MRRTSLAVTGVLAALSLAVLPACQKDEPSQELPCEYYRNAKASAKIPEHCKQELQQRGTTAPTPTTTPAPTTPTTSASRGLGY